MTIIDKIKTSFVKFLMKEHPPREFPLSDFDRVKYEIRPCDVLLIEGRSRISEVIKIITQSPWSHAALYIGRLHDIDNPVLRERVKEFYSGSPDTQLLIESNLGKGTTLVTMEKYHRDHIRICRPKSISQQDAQKVISFGIRRLGMQYAVRHVFDLARFLLPWNFFPRKWRSSLFTHHQDASTKEICSSMIAEAFAEVKYPILPIFKKHKEKGLQLYHRNPRLFTPSDFDYSPFFEIIKYPILELSDEAIYRNLPWSDEKVVSDDEGEHITPKGQSSKTDTTKA